MDLLENDDYKESILTLEDFPFICRICCLKRSDLRLFQEENYLWNLFHSIRKIDVHSTEEFPKNVCNECISKLKEITLFIDASKYNDESFGNDIEPKKEIIEYTDEIESTLSRKSRGMIEENGAGSQICRICSANSPTPFEERMRLIHLFGNITNFEVKDEFSDSKINIICNKCNNELVKISSFVTSSLCNDQKLEHAIGRITMKTENYSYPIDTEFSTCQDLKLESDIDRNETVTENSAEETSFIHDSKVKPEIVYIKEEIIDSDLVTSTDIDVNLITGSEQNPFKCDYCNESFANKWNLKQHMRYHPEKRPFKCDICEKYFSRLFNLKQHMITHNGEKIFKCDYCEKKYARKEHLQRHMLTHSVENPFKCHSCEKSFENKLKLRHHLYTHTEKTPFKCDTCGKMFKLKKLLRQHLFCHIGEKQFKCDICKKCFTWKSNLQEHMLTHTGEKSFNCDSCSMKFMRKQSLQRHMLTHGGQKPFKCKCCDKSFSRNFSLREHITYRSGANRFKCASCVKCYSRKRGLNEHMEKNIQKDDCGKN